jgi:TonB-linked SusC/RagA family outer membrane protein
MKKNLTFGLLSNTKARSKIFSLMRISYLLLFFTVFQLSAAVNNTQGQISLKMKDASIKEVFNAISLKCDKLFFYSDSEIDLQKKININANDQSIEEILESVLAENGGFDYEIMDDYVVIMPKNEEGEKSIAPMAIKIKGKITDSDGAPLPGATIMEKGTTNGTTSDIEGNYSLTVSEENSVIQVSYIGFEPQETTVGAKILINFILNPSSSSLNEVVVTGMFTKRKETYTGAVTTITDKEIKLYGSRSLITTIKNIDPAFNIIENNKYGSDPNRLPEINIRGTSSLPSIKQLANNVRTEINTPLIILDGFEISLQRMIDLNIDEVKSITLLKDASATAIYGSRGANGIIVITRKEPEQGKLKISYSSNINLEFPDLTTYDLLNAKEKLDLEVKAGLFASGKSNNDLYLTKVYNKKLEWVNQGINTDWMSKPLRTGIGQRHNLRAEGGDKYFRYSVAVSYNHKAGTMKGSNRNSFSGDINLSYHYKNIIFNNYLSIDLNKSENSPYGSFNNYAELNPYWHPYDENGKIIKRFEDFDFDRYNHPEILYDVTIRNLTTTSNPLYNATLNTIDASDHTKISNNFSIQWNLLEDLTMRSMFGISKNIRNSRNFKPANHTDFEKYDAQGKGHRKGRYRRGNVENFNYNFKFTLSYSKIFAEKHHIYFGLNYNMSEQSSESYDISVEGFPHEKLNFLAMALQYEKGSMPSGSESTTRSMGVTGNLNYSYDDRYFADLSYRVDGSSQFGSNKRFAPFWSVGIGWNIHKENFFNNDSEFINRLKIIASYGVTGSQQFSAYQAISTLRYYTNNRYGNWIGARLMGLGNEDLEWQTTKQYNIGCNATFINKINLNANVYYKVTSNLLSQMDIPLANGFSSYMENIGEVENRGFEIRTSVNLIKKANLFWSVTGSLAYNKNKIVKLSEAIKKQNKKIVEQEGSNPNRLLFEGDPINALYVVPSLGIDPSTGKEVFVKKNGENTYVWDARDRVYVGENASKFRGNLSTLLKYRNLEMNISFGFYFGGVTYNSTLIDKVENADKRYNVDRRVYEDRWMKPGDITFFKGIKETGSTRYSSRFVQDRIEFSCQNINLTYRLENDWVKKKMGLNILEFTCNMGDIFYFSAVKRERGTFYPFSHKITFSIRATF